ncbi:Hypothetical_protein [Hexamita inflata]|uniref:Hypothetical_protein n=1 Tax=Hexamita inflata TaxID=28002 RepID=A0AA86UKQ2_9EUKA|nr:Hypothetical protein HINF_LOCUS30843 [Hexamita inflata]
MNLRSAKIMEIFFIACYNVMTTIKLLVQNSYTGAPSKQHLSHIYNCDLTDSSIQQIYHDNKSDDDILRSHQSKQYDTELAKSLGFQCYCEQTYKYKSRFLIGEMLVLKRIYIENQDATIPQICELFQKETQMAISAYTAKRILEGLNVGKNPVINKYLLDKGVDVDFKW